MIYSKFIKNNTKQQTKNFYNQQSQKRDTTRQKIWPEFEIILKQIKQSRKKNIKILDLWCGNANVLQFLTDNQDFHKKNIDYTWVDIAENLIQIAKNKFPNSKFEANDMIDFIETQKQESFDFVFLIASLQHIPTEKERLIILKNIYRILKYKWYLIFIDWCFSKRFIKKYKKYIFKAFCKNFFTLGYLKANDLYIPWKWENQIYQRYYHIFTQNEKIRLTKQAWFCIEKLLYLDNKWNLINSWNWRNSIAIAQKEVIS